jgi:starvation-inducible DNA-binding protein
MPRNTFYGHTNVKVTIQPNIGLDAAARHSVVEILNILLADETVLSLKTRRADEEAEAAEIPNLHPLYQEQYRQINEIGSELVERISILGESHVRDSEALIDSARLDGKFASTPDGMSILADHEAFIRYLRDDAQKCSEIYEDQGTFALLVSILRIHEKIDWVLRLNIGAEQFQHEK